MTRWFGNMLRTNGRALALPASQIGYFTWWSVLDQALSIWTTLAGPASILLAAAFVSPWILPIYFAWVMFTRYGFCTVIMAFRGRSFPITFPFLLYFSQVGGAVVKSFILFRLDRQKWTARRPQAAESPSPSANAGAPSAPPTCTALPSDGSSSAWPMSATSSNREGSRPWKSIRKPPATPPLKLCAAVHRFSGPPGQRNEHPKQTFPSPPSSTGVISTAEPFARFRYRLWPRRTELEGRERIAVLRFDFDGYTISLQVNVRISRIHAETGELRLDFLEPTGDHLPPCVICSTVTSPATSPRSTASSACANVQRCRKQKAGWPGHNRQLDRAYRQGGGDGCAQPDAGRCRSETGL